TDVNPFGAMMDLTRRRFLDLSIAAGLGALDLHCSDNSAPPVRGMDAGSDGSDGGSVADGGTITTRVLIIGSGFGGAVAALRLAQAGISSVMLERGKRWPITSTYDTFASLVVPPPNGRSTWLSNTTVLPFGPMFNIDRYVGVLQRVQGDGINL